MDLLRTEKTYATRQKAVAALKKAAGENFSELRYVIATNEEGRFGPVVIGAEWVPLAHFPGITVVA